MQFDSLTLADQQRIDRWCVEFEDGWLHGRRPALERYVQRAAEPLREALLAELLKLELVYRRRLGETPVAEDYLSRLPQHQQLVEQAFHSLPSGDAAEPLGEGEQIGRYRILRLLGRGGFGEVYLAHDQDLERNVAVKVPRTEWADDQRLVEEARTAARLRHPSIASVYDVGRLPDRRAYVVMEHVEGQSLRERLRAGPLPPREAAGIVAQVARAAAAAHQQGVVHRDLEPRNVLLDTEGRPHVVDFGLALHDEQQADRAGELAGSLPYMAPEQLRGDAHQLDGRADIWAMGVMLYELLCGRRPFAGDHPQRLREEIRQRPPRPPRQIRPEIPVRLERACLKCLSKDPGQRFATAADLARALQPPAWTRRWQLVALLALVVLLALAVVWARPRPLDVDLRLLVWRGVWRPLDAVPLRAGDAVSLQLQLSRPRRLYLFWINADGSVEPLYPWSDGQWGPVSDPGRQTGLRLPAGEQTQAWEMPAGQPTGIEALALLASSARQDPQHLQQRLADLPPSPAVALQAPARFHDGVLSLDPLPQRSFDASRKTTVDDRLVRWQQQLTQRLAGPRDVVQVLVFATGP